jgi:hypothetical protein
MTPIVIHEVLVDGDDRALLLDGGVYHLRVFLAPDVMPKSSAVNT